MKRIFSTTDITRRSVLKSLLASATFLNTACWADPSLARSSQKPGLKRIVLIELDGGNDGLNTVIPYSQERYYQARPVIAVPKDQVLPLDEHLGLHPELEPLLAAWQAKDLHIALGVGYPGPNRSHFRSMDIWNTASGSEVVLDDGWLTHAFDDSQKIADAIIFGGNYGPLSGSSQSLVVDNLEMFARQAASMKPLKIETDNPALMHVMNVRQQISGAVTALQQVLDARATHNAKITGSDFYKQLHVISELIAVDAQVPVLKATLKGFDTHYHQINRHKNLMQDLGASLAVFRERLIANGGWDNTLVMTYSEFGRRPAENGSRGTDHGTSAPMLITGGGVRGGFSGVQPQVPMASDQDMSYALDYRQLYRTVAEKWLDKPVLASRFSRFERLEFV